MRKNQSSHIAYVAFGANLGRRRFTVEKALRELAVDAVSDLYETTPVGGPPGQRPYLNAVARLSWTKDAPSLLRRLLAVERRFGRVRGVRWGARTLDLDLLAFDRQTLRTPRLTLPHPRYHERPFVLVPFCDLAPDYVHPRLKRTNRRLLRQLTSDAGVTMMGRWKNSRFQPFRKRRRNARPSSR